MSIGPRERFSRAGIQRAAPVGFRQSGFRDRFITDGKADHASVPPSWYTQTLTLLQVEVPAGDLLPLELGTVAGPAGRGEMEVWGLRYFDPNIADFTDVTNETGTQFSDVVFKIISERGTVFTTTNMIRRGWKPFRTYFVGGERLYLYIWNLQTNAVQFNIEVTLDIEPLGRIEELLYGKI